MSQEPEYTLAAAKIMEEELGSEKAIQLLTRLILLASAMRFSWAPILLLEKLKFHLMVRREQTSHGTQS